MMRVAYVVQRLDTGEFVGQDDGESVYYINFAKAHHFELLADALHFALDIDPYLAEVTIHQIYEPLNYQSIVV